jgi:transcriptional regulator
VYVPQHFSVDDLTHLHEVIRRNGFGVATSMVDGRLMATHLPFMIDPDRGARGTLLAHMARANPHWRGFNGKSEVLVVFSGPHGYISPRWYEAKGPAVPTWNYVAVHAYGVPVVRDDVAESRAHLGQLASIYEAGRARPWHIDDEPKDFIDKMVPGVVAFEIPIARLEGKAKLSQNRPAEERVRVIAALRAEGETALADAMDAAKT